MPNDVYDDLSVNVDELARANRILRAKMEDISNIVVDSIK